MKTHSGAKKRFVLTASGKIKGKATGMRHNLGTKTTKQKRHLNQDTILGSTERDRVLNMLNAPKTFRKKRRVFKAVNAA